MFKKIIILLSSICFIFFLTSCSAKEKTEQFELESRKVSIKVSEKGNKVTNIEMNMKIPYSKNTILNEKEGKEQIEPNIEKQNKIEGVTANIEYGEEYATQKIAIKVNELNMEQLDSLPNKENVVNGIPLDNYKDYKEILVSNGYKIL